VRFVKILRLIRILKLKNIFVKLETYINLSDGIAGFLGFLKLAVLVLFISHWIACIWHLIGNLEAGHYPENWIYVYGIQDADFGMKYVSSVYWAISTMITVGYGDIVPVTLGEKIYSIFVMLIASAVFAYSMNRINALLSGLDGTTGYSS